MPDKFKGVKFLPALIGVAVACIVLAVALMLYGRLSGNSGAAASGKASTTAELLALSQGMPLQAASALAGDAKAFDALAESHALFESLAPGLAPGVQDTAAVFLQQASTVVAAKEASLRTAAAAREVSALMPLLLEGLGNVAGALSINVVAKMTPQLERFEVTGLRIDQDLTALASGVGDVAMLSLRLSDGLG